MLNFRFATKEDIQPMAEMAALSFKDYPFYTRFVKPRFTDEKMYLSFIRKVLAVQFRIDQKKGFGVIISDNSMPVGVALASPSLAENSIWDYLLSGGFKLFPYFKGGLLNDFLNQSDIAEKRYRQEANQETWYLSFLAVNENYQGHGLGSAILNKHLIPRLQTNDIKRLALITNTDKSYHFYESNNFKCFDQTKLVLNNRQIDNWCFIKNI